MGVSRVEKIANNANLLTHSMGQSVRLEAELEDDDALSVDFSENGRFGRNGIDFTAWPDHGVRCRAAPPVPSGGILPMRSGTENAPLMPMARN